MNNEHNNCAIYNTIPRPPCNLAFSVSFSQICEQIFPKILTFKFPRFVFYFPPDLCSSFPRFVIYWTTITATALVTKYRNTSLIGGNMFIIKSFKRLSKGKRLDDVNLISSQRLLLALQVYLKEL